MELPKQTFQTLMVILHGLLSCFPFETKCIAEKTYSDETEINEWHFKGRRST